MHLNHNQDDVVSITTIPTKQWNVAEWLMHLTLNQGDVGSKPTVPTKKVCIITKKNDMVPNIDNKKEKVKPIKPEELRFDLSDETIEIINSAIRDKWDGDESRLLYNDLSQKIKDISLKDACRIDNIIPIYRNFGWDVFTENFNSVYIFKKKKNKKPLWKRIFFK